MEVPAWRIAQANIRLAQCDSTELENQGLMALLEHNRQLLEIVEQRERAKDSMIVQQTKSIDAAQSLASKYFNDNNKLRRERKYMIGGGVILIIIVALI